jgi:hypothetical protein
MTSSFLGFPDQLTLDELNEDAVASVKLGHGRDYRVGKFAGVVLLPRMSRPSGPNAKAGAKKWRRHRTKVAALFIERRTAELERS